MWVPREWSQIVAMLGTEETASLDFKRELGSNTEVAKDVAAMTLNGGIIVVGLDQDPKSGLATAIVKQPLAGIEERIQQVVASRISPAPDIEVILVRENPADVDGVLVLLVPGSSAGPHMAGDRYPRRLGTTTKYLSEPEVARLYGRRRELSGAIPEPAELMKQFRVPPAVDGADPSSMVVGVGRVRMIVRPVADVTHPRHPWLHDPLQGAYHALESGLRPRITWEREPPAVTALDGWRPYGTAGWVAGASGGVGDRLLREDTHAAVLSYPSGLCFQATWGLHIGAEGEQLTYRTAREPDVALTCCIWLGFAGEFLAGIDGVGPVVASLETSGFSGAVSWRATRARPDVSSDGLPQAGDVVESTVTATRELLQRPEVVGRRLLDPWLVAFYQFRDLFDDLID
jgi:hypothetical protein